MLTQERAQILANYLNADIDRAKKLLEMAPEAAMNEINAAGHDFTVEEIVEFGKQLQAAAAQEGELDEEALNNVAGGLVVEGVVISCVALGFKIGTDLAKNYGW